MLWSGAHFPAGSHHSEAIARNLSTSAGLSEEKLFPLLASAARSLARRQRCGSNFIWSLWRLSGPLSSAAVDDDDDDDSLENVEAGANRRLHRPRTVNIFDGGCTETRYQGVCI